MNEQAYLVLFTILALRSVIAFYDVEGHKKVLNDKIKVQKAFKEKGFFVLILQSLSRYKKFFLDICSFFVLIIRDDRRFIKYADSIDQSILSQDINQLIKKYKKQYLKYIDVSLGKIYEMGTHPNKFLSGEKLFFNKEIVRISKYFSIQSHEIINYLLNPKGEKHCTYSSLVKINLT